MKRIRSTKIALTAGLLLLAVLLSACEWEPQAEPVPTTELLIGCFAPDGSDPLINASHEQAMSAISGSLGLNQKQILLRSGGMEELTALAELGCHIIFITGATEEEAVMELAAAYPETQFCICGGYWAVAGHRENAHNYYGPMEDIRYAAGAAAAAAGCVRLGYIAAWPEASSVSGAAAMLLGAQQAADNATEKAAEKASMEIIYLYGYSGEDAVFRAAQTLAERGAQLIATDTAETEALLLTAELNDILCLGYSGRETEHTALLAAIEWDWRPYIRYALDCLLAGEEISRDWSGAVADGVCRLHNFNAPATQQAAEAALAALASGEAAVFSGPLLDSDGQALLEEGEVYSEPLSAPGWDRLPEGVTVVK